MRLFSKPEPIPSTQTPELARLDQEELTLAQAVKEIAYLETRHADLIYSPSWAEGDPVTRKQAEALSGEIDTARRQHAVRTLAWQSAVARETQERDQANLTRPRGLTRSGVLFETQQATQQPREIALQEDEARKYQALLQSQLAALQSARTRLSGIQAERDSLVRSDPFLEMQPDALKRVESLQLSEERAAREVADATKAAEACSARIAAAQAAAQAGRDEATAEIIRKIVVVMADRAEFALQVQAFLTQYTLDTEQMRAELVIRSEALPQSYRRAMPVASDLTSSARLVQMRQAWQVPR